MYGTIARYPVKPGHEQQLLEEMRRFEASPPPGWQYTSLHRSVDRPTELWMSVVFESEEAYKRNAASAEMDARFQSMLEHLDSEPEWHDGDVIHSGGRTPDGPGLRLEVRSLGRADENRTPRDARIEVVNLGANSIGRFTFQPGWTWASSVKAVAGTEHCEKPHVGYCVAGEMNVWLTDGTRATIKAGDSYTIPPGHDAEVVGDQPFVGIEFSSAATYAKK